MFLFLVIKAILEVGWTYMTQFCQGTSKGQFHQTLVQNGSAVSKELIKIEKFTMLPLTDAK